MRVKQEVQELFPTPLWVVDLPPAEAAGFNAKLRAEIENIVSPRPKVPSGPAYSPGGRHLVSPGFLRA